jgi:hypothetical protein
MYVRQATLNDKEKWDSFVDSEQGSFFHYFDWKYIWEIRGHQYLPLFIENKSSEIIGILPVVKTKYKFYSSIKSQPEGSFGGFVLKKDLTTSEKNKAITLLLGYVDKKIANNCSTYTYKENLLLSINDKNPTQPSEILIKSGFEYKYNSNTQLPCTYILELKQSFENNIWNDLWDHRLKNKIKKSQKMGIHIIEDQNLKYFNDFYNMFQLSCDYMRINYQRRKSING